MAWSNSNEGSHIPERTKRQIRRRDNGQCQLAYPGICLGKGTEFDHVINIKTLRIERKHANDPALLQLVCSSCHKIKTQAEAQAGRKRHLRPPLEHPGLVVKKTNTDPK